MDKREIHQVEKSLYDLNIENRWQTQYHLRGNFPPDLNTEEIGFASDPNRWNHFFINVKAGPSVSGSSGQMRPSVFLKRLLQTQSVEPIRIIIFIV
jgi:hypothetical protein